VRQPLNVIGLLPGARRSHARAHLRHEAAGSRTRNQPAQVGDRAAANRAHLQPAGEFIEQALGCISGTAQQQPCRLAFVRQHLFGKDQVTTTRRVRRIPGCGARGWLY